MRETPFCHFNLEWPQPGACICGPLTVLRGWIVGKDGFSVSDVRIRIAGVVWSGVLGFPRTDLADHFNTARSWLPAEFAIALDLTNGATELILEAGSASDEWVALQTFSITVAPEGEASPAPAVRLLGHQSRRDPPKPFTGHLEDPALSASMRQAQGGLFGWLRHSEQKITAVLATTDLGVFNQLDYDLSNQADAPESDIPLAYCFAGYADLLSKPIVCVRIYAQLDDGSVHLCLAQRVTPLILASEDRPQPARAISPALWIDDTTRAPDFPSGRPRRIVLGVLNLHESDATLRALDVARHLVNTGRWIAHVVSTAEGPLRHVFEEAGISVQLVDPRPAYRAADHHAGHAALHELSRQIFWKHQDTAVIFDPLCFWMIAGAARHNVPVIFDCAEDTALDACLAPATRPLVAEAWPLLAAVCFTALNIARRQAAVFAPLGRQVVIPPWTHVPATVPARDDARAQIAFPPHIPLAVSFNLPVPEQGSSTLLRAFTGGKDQGYIALPRSFPGNTGISFTRDASLNQARILMPPAANSQLWLAAADACVNTALNGPSLRSLLDAALAGRPIVTTDLPLIREFFSPVEVHFIPAGDAHALSQTLGQLDPADGRIAAAQTRVSRYHDARLWLPRYHSFLEAMVADRLP